MRQLVTVLMVAILVNQFAGCASTGGTVGGLIPAPKFLKGEVSQDIYTAPEGAFSVRLPYSTTSNEWTYAEVREVQDGPVTGVIFGPGAFDRNYYHAVLLKMSIPEDKDAYVEKLFSRKAADRPGNFREIVSEQFLTRGNQTYYSAYESNTGYLVLSLTDLGNSFFVVEADVSKGGARGQTNSEELQNRMWVVFNEMLSSFEVK